MTRTILYYFPDYLYETDREHRFVTIESI